MARKYEGDQPELSPEPEQRGMPTPKPAEEIGLGGPGTEGKPGPAAGGTEPQIPEDVTNPLESEEELRKSAERLAEDLGVDLGGG